MIFAFICVSTYYLGKSVLPNGNIAKLKEDPSYKKGWYFVQYEDKSDISKLQDTYGIPVKTQSLVSYHWLKLYLLEDKITLLLQDGSYKLFKISKSERLASAHTKLLDDDSNYLVHVHSSFKPPKYFKRFGKDYYTTKNLDPAVLKDPAILKISQIRYPSLRNRWATGVTQTEKVSLNYEGKYLVPLRPIHLHGIQGQGEVVTIVDSGLNVDKCFFNDPSVKFEVNTTMPTHRKVIRYEAYGDDHDDNGHGTHVSGMASGDSDQDTTAVLYNGQAPKSKIYFVDAAKGFVGTLNADFDYEEVIEHGRSVNSTVYSNSWGYDPPFDDVRAIYDAYLNENPDVLMLFASGNDHSAFTVNAPGVCKTVIAVASTSSGEISSKASNPTYNLKFDNGESIPLIYKSGSKPENLLKNDPIPVYQNQKIGKEFMYFDDSNQDTCTDAKPLVAFVPSSSSLTTCGSVPLFSFDNEHINKFKAASTATLFVNATSENGSITYRASGFNSYGPTNNGLLKPDFLAPGEGILSAKYNTNTCSANDLRSSSGTSMATPAAAGAALLVNQYFHQGFYPSGKSTKEDEMPKLKAYLTKGVMINSAGRVKDGNDWPTVKEGFGVIHLENVLVFDDDVNKGLRISDNFTINSKEELVSTFKVTKTGSRLAVTLTWLDPGVSEESLIPVFADLDLFIETPSGKNIFGNTQTYEESHSTNERVVIINPELGDYVVHVRCPNLPIKISIEGIVVVNAPFDQVDYETNPKFLQFKPLSSPRPECDDDHTGTFCQHNVINHQSGETFTATLEYRKDVYHSINLPDISDRQELSITIEAKNTQSTFVHVGVDLKQVYKFGGEQIWFSNFTSKELTKKIVLKKDSYKYPENKKLYITFYENRVSSQTVTVKTELKILDPVQTPSATQSPTSSTSVPTASQSKIPPPTRTQVPTQTPTQSPDPTPEIVENKEVDEHVKTIRELEKKSYQISLTFLVVSILQFIIIITFIGFFCYNNRRNRQDVPLRNQNDVFNE